MIAIYSKRGSNGKVMITKQIDCFEINNKTKDITIYYMKNGKPKEKRFSYKDKLIIK